MTAATFRAVILALVAALAPLAAGAHSMSYSLLTFSRDADSLDLSIMVPLDELVIALPSAAGLEDLPAPADLPVSLQKDLAAYFAAHLALTPADQPALQMQMIAARLLVETSEDFGTYTLLTVDLTSPLPADQDLSSLTVAYDAVIHEVRSHSALVLVQDANKSSMGVGEISFDAALGQAQSLVVSVSP